MDIISAAKRLVPNPLKRAIKDMIGITALENNILELRRQINQIEDMMSGKDLKEISKKRWREVEPESHLTWRKKINGDNFVKKMQCYAHFSKEKKMLEIGPGYGRVLKSILEMKIPFKKYTALDISQKNVAFLKSNFTDESIEFLNGDVESFSFHDQFDIVFSSLTFKHFFPTFENALKNLDKFMNPGGLISFDLLEGNRRGFENDGVTYMHFYTKEKVIAILQKIPMELVSFDSVKHAHGYIRLFVVAKKT